MDHHYSISADFSGALDVGQLHGEIVADPIITTTLVSCSRNSPGFGEDDMCVTFDAIITSAEQIVLDGLVAAHTGAAPGSWTVALDEVNHLLRFQVTYSDGTYKEGTVDLVNP